MWGAKVCSERGDLFRRAEALLGDLGLEHGFDGFAAVGEVALPGASREEDVAGGNGVDADAFGA